MRTLQLRLSVIIFIIVSLTVTLSIFFFTLVLNARMDTLDDKSLSSQIEDISRYVSINNGQIVANLPEKLTRAYRAGGGHFIYIISREDGTVVSRYGTQSVLRTPDLDMRTDTKKPAGLFSRLIHLAGEDLRFYAAEKWFSPDNGRNWVNIQVAQGPMHDNVLADEVLDELREGYGIPILGMLIALIIGVSWTIRLSLRPLIKLEHQAQNLRPGASNQKLAEDGVPSELVPLVNQMNNALTRLNEAYQQQKIFTDMAAHELRSPMAIIRAQAEQLPTSHEKSVLMLDIERMERLLGQLLQLQRSDSFVLRAEQKIDLVASVQLILAEIGSEIIAGGGSVELAAPDGPVWINGDQSMIEIILRNLIDNAVNAAGPQVQINCKVSESGSLTLCDNGPGLNADQYEIITERFYRTDQSRLNGVGLGLSIVKRLADAHLAPLSFDKADLGGLSVTLNFRLSV